jgi:hypothetical protein
MKMLFIYFNSASARSPVSIIPSANPYSKKKGGQVPESSLNVKQSFSGDIYRCSVSLVSLEKLAILLADTSIVVSSVTLEYMVK